MRLEHGKIHYEWQEKLLEASDVRGTDVFEVQREILGWSAYCRGHEGPISDRTKARLDEIEETTEFDMDSSDESDN